LSHFPAKVGVSLQQAITQEPSNPFSEYSLVRRRSRIVYYTIIWWNLRQ